MRYISVAEDVSSGNSSAKSKTLPFYVFISFLFKFVVTPNAKKKWYGKQRPTETNNTEHGVL